ncbi:MAG: CHAT domain-containing protein [Planctomycetes bacterium]|nr:CHAT domain-containing protein [Planctomycetota bacterium]
MGGEDGWLTAEEILGLDLSGVELLVLSACETGRGEPAAGEGVLGLSRALALAGARAFVLSLWRVPDAETRDLMAAFYDDLWGTSTTEALAPEAALRRAQLAALARDRAAGKFRPSTWGAWVAYR